MTLINADPNNVKCPYCEGKGKLESNSIIYGKEYGNGKVYVCENFPECDSYVGAYNDKKNTPKGTLADTDLREWRKKAHSYFDEIWKKGKMSRSAAYKLMKEKMNLQEWDAHIGLFNMEKCEQIIEISKKL